MRADRTTVDLRPPRIRLRDHARVAWLLVKSIFAFLPYLVVLPLTPILGPWFRRRLRRALESAPPSPAPTVDSLAAALAGHDLRGRRIFLVAGEESGDRMAARIIEALRERAPDVEIVGYGGPASAAAGASLYRDLTANAVMGVFAVIGSIGFWWKICAETLARFRETKPDLLLTVDFPGLNVRLAGWARKSGIRTVHMVAPQLWAHAPWRVVRWRAGVDHLLSTMPFEPPLFERSRIHTTYVGHPLFEEPLPAPRGAATRPPEAPVVELWPGSRRRELRHHVPILKAAAALLAGRLPGVQLETPLARPEHDALITQLWRDAPGDAPLPRLLAGGAQAHEHLVGALVTSGTATAQVAVDLVPQVVFYRLAWPTRILASVGIWTPWICLANLVAGQEVAPEHLVTGSGAAQRLVDDLLAQIGTDEAHAATRTVLERVRGRLATPQVADRVATLVLTDLAASGARADPMIQQG